MKAWIISLCLFILLISTIVGNAIYVNRVAHHIEDTVAALSFDDTKTSVQIDALEAYWEQHRPYVALSIGYRELDHLCESLISLRAAFDTKNASDFELYRQLTEDAAAELARLEQISVENLF